MREVSIRLPAIDRLLRPVVAAPAVDMALATNAEVAQDPFILAIVLKGPVGTSNRVHRPLAAGHAGGHDPSMFSTAAGERSLGSSDG